MNEALLRLLELIKIYNDGELQGVLEEEFKVFADTREYNIKTIEDLVEAMEVEMTYWEG